MIGQVIDVYRITRKLGQGGMGSVYEAIDTQLNRSVALKVMNVDDDEMFAKRFRTEAQALAKLDHPNIVRVIAMRETKFGLIIVMELIAGKTWSEYAAEGKFSSPEDTIKITTQLLRALAYAHSQGIVHRDIKPSNIMISADGDVKVADFGLAKLVDPRATMAQNPLTQVGQAVGSLFYMSPEQVKGLDSVDHRTDLYSSGITMYEVLAGRPPFDEKTATSPYVIQKKIVDGQLDPLTSSTNVVPKDLASIVSKATHVKPERRFQSADEMISALSECSSTQAQAQSPGPIARKASPALRTPLLKWGALAAAVLVVAIAAIYFAMRDPAPVQENLKNIALQIDPPDARVYVDGLPVANSALLELEPGQYDIEIRADGFSPFETTLNVSDADGQIQRYALVRADPADSLLAENNLQPTDASTSNEPSGTARTESGQTRSTPTNQTNQPTGQTSNNESATTAAVGTINVAKVGTGTATVGGQSGSGQFASGSSQTVTCAGGGLQSTKSVRVTAGASVTVTCYFTGRISVAAIDSESGTTMLAAFTVNGAPKGRKNPLVESVSVGSYTVSAGLDGYSGGSTTIQLKPGIDSAPTASGSITLRKL